VSKIVVQEFKLFRICLGLTFFAPLFFLPIEHFFVSPANRWWMYGVILLSMLYSAVLFRMTSLWNFHAGIHLFIMLHLLLDTMAVYFHAPPYLAICFVMTYTFIIVFTIILVSWPVVGIMDAIIFLCALTFMFVPGTGFLASLEKLGVDAPFAVTAILVYFVLLLVLGTGMVEIKRRTEKQLRELNLTLNKRVEEKVAEFQKADRAAWQSQEQLERILRNIPVGVVIIDEKLNPIYTNGVHFRFELKNGELLENEGGSLPLTVLEEHFLRDKASRLLEQEEDLIGQKFEYTTPDGMKKTIRYSYVYVKLTGEEAECIRLVLITEDITEEEAIRDKLIQTNHLAGMGKMAASLVHELNNPLTGIRLNLELLELGLAAPDRRQEVFRALSEGIERIDRIVKSFLSFARQDQPKKVRTDVRTILQDMLAMAVNFKQFHCITIQTEFAEQLPKIDADRYRLEQVFVNLLNNACDAMARKGGLLRIITTRDDDFVIVKFQDNGIGIKKEDLSNIFSPFFTTKERGYGTGLGLSTSYGIVHEHGGNIEVESREGMGSTFTIRLPFASGEVKSDD